MREARCEMRERQGGRRHIRYSGQVPPLLASRSSLLFWGYARPAAKVSDTPQNPPRRASESLAKVFTSPYFPPRDAPRRWLKSRDRRGVCPGVGGDHFCLDAGGVHPRGVLAGWPDEDAAAVHPPGDGRWDGIGRFLALAKGWQAAEGARQRLEVISSAASSGGRGARPGWRRSPGSSGGSAGPRRRSSSGRSRPGFSYWPIGWLVASGFRPRSTG